MHNALCNTYAATNVPSNKAIACHGNAGIQAWIQEVLGIAFYN